MVFADDWEILMVRPHFQQWVVTKLKIKNMLDQHQTKEIEEIQAHKQERQYPDHKTLDKKIQGNESFTLKLVYTNGKI